MLSERIESVRQACTDALRQPEFLAVEEALRKHSIAGAAILSLVQQADESSESRESLLQIKSALNPAGSDGIFERYLIVNAALHSLGRLPQAPVPERVAGLLCDEFQLFAQPDAALTPLFRVGEYRFVAMCKTASLRRYPAGQLDWEISGLPRSDLFHVPKASSPRLLHFAAMRLGGFRPLFTSHMANRRPARFVLLESEMNRSYYLIASAMKLQPAIKGLFTKAWFYSPDTFEVSPHLSWTTKVIRENGGWVSPVGPAAPDSGVFERSPERRKAFEAGKFRPTLGLVVWARKDMIGWADRHPEMDHA